MKTIKNLEINGISWINITSQSAKELNFLRNNFDFSDIDLEDCSPPLQRPKLLERDDYLFLILQFPVYDRETKKISAAEVDFFVLPDKLITVHNDTLVPIDRFFLACRKEKNIQKKLIKASAPDLLFQLLEELLLYCFPMLNHINWEIDEAEKKIFSRFDRQTVRKILNIKRNIVNFRKSMQAHKNVLKKLAEKNFDLGNQNHFNELVEKTKEIWDLLENYRESINALYETHESLANFRLGDIMKTLTIFSVVVFPLTLLAAIFGMNTVNGMPFVRSPFGFWGVIGIMAIGSVAMFIYFKKKRWI